MNMSVTPEQFNRRSFVHPRLVAAGAEFREIAGAALATGFPQQPAPALGLADLSPVPRTGVKGPRALAWLGEKGWPVPEANNRAVRSEDGHVIARLADGEALILAPTDGDGRAVYDLEAAIPGEGAWATPRRDSSCWFRLQGDAAVDCLQKLCGVDLREKSFPVGSIAQTSVARLNCVVIRDPDNAFHLLTDSASAIWFWDNLLDAMAEFDGGPVGA
jgi:sarcosine oxidase, subunit gamma